MNRGTAFIQPHSDDAVMSMYYTIKSGYLPKPYFLITAFSESDWIDPVQRIFLEESHVNLSQGIITNLRKLEDVEFANNCDMKCVFLGMPDSKIRTGGAIFDPSVSLDTKIITELHLLLDKMLQELQIGTIVFPCPVGKRQQIDHRILFDACSKLKSYTKYLIDDFPYSRIDDSALYIIAHEIQVGSPLEKFKMMSLYKTQMNSYFYEDILSLHNKNKGIERLLKTI